MLFQLCRYKEKEGDEERFGLARMVSGFNTFDLEYLIDLETGHKPKTVWDYGLIAGPLAYLDTELCLT